MLSEKTLIPLSFAATLGGVVFWASTIAARVDAQSQHLNQIESHEQMILQMRDDLARIGARVDMIYDRVKK